MTIQSLLPYLSDLDSLHATTRVDDKTTYVHPALRQLGAVTIVYVREIIAPTVFRNSEAEITDIEVETSTGIRRAVRAVPQKFKHRERARGLQILRAMNAGGMYPQNKLNVPDSSAISDIFDLNSFVFGESANRKNSVLPVKAAALYSDGLSLTEYEMSVGSTFHNRAAEDGTLFDAIKKGNSSNIFDRHFVLPGTKLVQAVTTVGKVMPPEAFDHLLLCSADAGVYGGQTAISAVNVRNHIAGIFAGRLEKAESSPYLLAADFLASDSRLTVDEIKAAIFAKLAPLYSTSVTSEEATAYTSSLVKRLEDDDQALRDQYQRTNEKIGELFQLWFEG